MEVVREGRVEEAKVLWSALSELGADFTQAGALPRRPTRRWDERTGVRNHLSARRLRHKRSKRHAQCRVHQRWLSRVGSVLLVRVHLQDGPGEERDVVSNGRMPVEQERKHVRKECLPPRDGDRGEVEKGSGLGMCPHQRLSDPAVILHGTGPA